MALNLHAIPGGDLGAPGGDPGTAAGTSPPDRIALIDILRGLVIVIMALDHTREFTHASGWAFNPLSPTDSTPLLFATRWITHLCAPTFVFLAGVSIRLQAINGRTGVTLARRIASRGLWLIVLELTLVGFFWSFSIPFLQFWQVIWAIGWSMILLAGLIFLRPIVSLIVGALIVIASTFFLAVPPDAFGSLGGILFRGVAFLPSFETMAIFVAYPIVPWFGVMAVGYGAGHIFLSPRRSTLLARIGLAMLAAFLILRLPNLPGDLRPWAPQSGPFWTVASFFDVTKNPPSLDFVLVTLGLMLALAPLIERLPRRVTGLFRTYGSVPLIAYVAHVGLMHLYAIIARAIAGGPLAPMTDTMRAFMLEQERFGTFSLPLGWVYVVWLAVVATLYPLCRWWAGVKRHRRDWWMAYL